MASTRKLGEKQNGKFYSQSSLLGDNFNAESTIKNKEINQRKQLILIIQLINIDKDSSSRFLFSQ